LTSIVEDFIVDHNCLTSLDTLCNQSKRAIS